METFWDFPPGLIVKCFLDGGLQRIFQSVASHLSAAGQSAPQVLSLFWGHLCQQCLAAYFCEQQTDVEQLLCQNATEDHLVFLFALQPKVLRFKKRIKSITAV